MKTSLILFLPPLLAASTAAFTAPNRSVVPTISNEATACSTPIRSGHGVIWSLRMAASDGGDEATTSTPPTKRRKRKDGNRFPPPSLVMSDTIITETAFTTRADPPEETPPAPAASYPNADVLVMRVRDIRDVVSGAPESPSFDDGGDQKDDDAVVGEGDDDDESDDDELADDEEWEYYDVDDDGKEIVASSSGGGRRSAADDARQPPRDDDAIDQLLADARRMRAASSSEGQSQTTTQTQKTRGVKETIFEVISTIVTVDFFVVLALLAWFLAGIFCSYILKDDAVQIAFNMNFERLTQPALGILMIGSVAGAAFGNEEEGE